MVKSISLIVASGLLAATCAAQQQTLYTAANPMSDQGVSVRPWGGGGVSETTELAPTDARTVRIGTRNYYQGGIIRFSKAPNLATDFKNKDDLLRVTIKLPTSVMNATPTGNGGTGNRGGAGRGDGGEPRPGGGAPAGVPGLPPGAYGGGQPPTGAGLPPSGGGPPGSYGGGQRGGSTPPGVPPQFGGFPPGVPGAPTQAVTGGKAVTTQPSNLRMIVTTSDGKKSETYLQISNTFSKSGNWFDLAVPLQSLSGFDKTNKEIVSIALSTDIPSTFYVKKIDVTNDTTPIYATIEGGDDINLAYGDEYTFIGQGDGGATALKYEWNFDADNSQGVDAEGQVVKRKFRKAGTFTVKLTVSDIYGLKKPYSTSIKVTVNP